MHVEIQMKTELKSALRLITKAQNDPRVGPDGRNRLRKAKEELLAGAHGGKLDERRVCRATELVALALMEALEAGATLTSK